MAVFNPQGKTFMVTGGASGMGAIYVGKFLEQGAKAVAVLDVAVEQGETLAARHNQNYPGRVIFLKCDVSKEDEIEKTFNEVVSKLKRVDVIINNAGIMVDTLKVWRVASDVNWQGVVSFTLKGIKHMSKGEGGAGGTIMNIASTAALSRSPFLPIYCGSKAAVMQFCQCLAMDPFYADTDVRILCMCFGPTDTPLLHNLETRALDPNMGKILGDFMKNGIANAYQKAESAIAAVDYAIKNGANGSIWLSTDDKPARNITPVVDEAFALYDKVLADNAK